MRVLDVPRDAFWKAWTAARASCSGGGRRRHIARLQDRSPRGREVPRTYAFARGAGRLEHRRL